MAGNTSITLIVSASVRTARMKMAKAHRILAGNAVADLGVSENEFPLTAAKRLAAEKRGYLRLINEKSQHS